MAKTGIINLVGLITCIAGWVFLILYYAKDRHLPYLIIGTITCFVSCLMYAIHIRRRIRYGK